MTDPRKLKPTRALAFLVNMTTRYWQNLPVEDIASLWTKFRDYVLNGFKDVKTSRTVEEVWEKCKTEIEEYLAKL